jgi:transcriptional regulator with XRE-family HTH domain
MNNLNNLLKLRKANNVKAVDLATQLGISRKHYYDLEKGARRLNIDHINRLAKIYNVSTDEVVGNTPITEEQKKPKELLKFLEQSDVMFDGVPLNEDDKEKVRKALELAFWDAKQQNRRK